MYLTGSNEVKPVRHKTLADAEKWIADQEKLDPEGTYYLDGPCMGLEAQQFSYLLIAGEFDRLKNWAANHGGGFVLKTFLEAFCSDTTVISVQDVYGLAESYGLLEG